jgi:hypothetical protein
VYAAASEMGTMIAVCGCFLGEIYDILHIKQKRRWENEGE